MATFLEARINDRVTAETVFEIEHPSRVKVYGVGGQLEQVFCDVPPRHLVALAHGIKTRDQFQSIVDAFYVVMFTPHTGLRVKNWQDYEATATNSAVLALAGSPGEYQLQRKHTFGAVTFLRNIKKPVNNGALVVYNAGGTPLTPTIDYTEGKFTVASGTPSYWTGEFDLPMTFVANKWRAKLEGSASRLYVENDPIEMEEILLP